MTACAGLAGAVIGILQIVIYTGASPAPVWIVIGGLLNFASGLPIYCSFKKGIFTECNNSPCIHKYSYIKAPAVRNEN